MLDRNGTIMFRLEDKGKEKWDIDIDRFLDRRETAPIKSRVAHPEAGFVLLPSRPDGRSQ